VTRAVSGLAAPRRTLPLAGVVGVGLAAAVVIALVHVTQGTADVGVRDIVALLFGGPDEQAAAVVVASRVPRLVAGVVVGVALGVAGAALQSLARNPLASPDTLGVDAGAYVALVVAAVFAVALPVPFAGGLAFVGGLAAAGLVLVLASGVGAGPTRLVLAGSAIALALDAVTVTLLLLFREHTVGCSGCSRWPRGWTCTAWATTPPRRSDSSPSAPGGRSCCSPSRCRRRR